MNQPNSTMRLLTGIAVAMIFCFCIQGVAYFFLHWGTGKTESNYFSTISRFQGAVAPGAEIAVAGSSITGRLPGREVGNTLVANLGSDGGSPQDGILLMTEGFLARPEWLVVETNTLFNGVGYGDTPAVGGARDPWFAIGGRFPLLGASARPSGMLYARLLSRSWKGPGEPFPLGKSPEIVNEVRSFDFTPKERERLEALVRKMGELRRSGVKILLAKYPAGEMKPRDQERMDATIARISSELRLPYIDLAGQIPRDSLEFTDSVHLGPASASRLLDTLLAVCRDLDIANP